MIAAIEEETGKGLGKLLVAQAENRAREHGCTTMRLELLTPSDWEHPVKKILDAWYARLGYVKGGPEPFEAAHPHIAPLLACTCIFTVYLKPL